ncbi:MAG: hypothetical protein JWO58_1180 [Chitinophagaceae bacterium]|nr:hypothetical protein [Chitinophagaceae bacterium]
MRLTSSFFFEVSVVYQNAATCKPQADTVCMKGND